MQLASQFGKITHFEEYLLLEPSGNGRTGFLDVYEIYKALSLKN